MRYLKGLVLPASMVALMTAAGIAPAQPAPKSTVVVPPIPLGSSGETSRPAPQWLVWRAFYRSVEFYASRSPNVDRDLLIEHAGLLDEEAAAVLTAGQDYLRQLTSIDDAARSEIRAHHQPKTKPPFLTDNVGGLSGYDENGSDLYQSLVASGFIASVERQKDLALAEHRRRVLAILGGARLTRLEAWLSVDVAPNVAVVMSSRPVAGPRRGTDFSPPTPALR